MYLGIDEKKERVLLELLRPVFMMDLPSATRSSDQLGRAVVHRSAAPVVLAEADFAV